jgi:O-antigen/teichoic acid export membrane protein
MSADLNKRGSQVGAGIFLIGLALLFLLNIAIWPYIMFVIAVSLVAHEYTEHNTIDFKNSRMVGAAIIAIIGLLGLVDFNFDWGRIWPLFLIGAGLFILFGKQVRSGKSKND